MLRWSNPAGFVLGVLLLAGLTAPAAVLAGNTHSEGGPVLEATGVPEMDGNASVNVYWAGDSSKRTTVTVGSVLAGHWLQDVGFNLTREWLVGDDHIAVLEYETDAGQTTHRGYYGVINKTMTSLDPEEYPAMTVRAIPVPVATAGEGFIDVTWTEPVTDAGSPAMNNIAGYDLLRSTDGQNFTTLNSTMLTALSFRDSTAVFGTNYHYALRLNYRGTPVYKGTELSGNSNVVTPLDIVPPDVPTLQAIAEFVPGTNNTLSWSDMSASGAVAYMAEASVDSLFSTIAASSGWIDALSFEFTDLQDGQTYFYRVRARDAGLNESISSAFVSSTQDATPPASNLLELTAYNSSSTVDLEWTASDSTSGVAGVRLFYAKDGGGFAEYPGGPFDTSPIPFDASSTGGDGSYAFYTLATDAVGNAEEAPTSPDASSIVDTQAPATPVLAALPAFAQGTSLLVSWNDEAASGAVTYRVQASATPDFATIASESPWISETEFNFIELTDGAAQHYRVQSRDAAGNESGFSDLALVTQDASAPETQAEVLAAYNKNASLEIAWSGNDATSGLVDVDLYFSKDGAAFEMAPGGPFTTSPIPFDTSLLGDGDYAFYTIGHDQVGNSEAAPLDADALTHVDTQAPEAPVLAALSAFTAGSSLMLSWTDNGDEYLAEVASDAAFTDILAQSDWMTGSSYEFTGLADGATFFFRAQARDAAGNLSAVAAAQTTTMDAIAPTTQALALAAIHNSSLLSIEWSGNDATSGLVDVDLYFSKDGTAFEMTPGGPFTASPIPFDTSLLGDGDYAFYTIGHDQVGNNEAAPDSADARTSIDTGAPDAPSITAIQPFTAGANFTLSWSDESASGAVAYQAEMSYAADFSSIEHSSGWIPALSYDYTGLEDGRTLYFRVQARDLANNATGFSGIRSTTMDASAPATQVAALPVLLATSNLEVAWAGTDATSGIQNVELWVSRNGAPFTLYPGSPFAASPIAFDATLFGGDGDYAFYTVGRDVVGNIEAAPLDPDAVIAIDTTAPNAPTLATLPAFHRSTTFELTWSDESASGASEYQVQLASDPSFANLELESDWMQANSLLFDALVDGSTYWFRVMSRDNAANQSAFSSSAQITIDASAPASAVNPLAAYNSSTFGIAWTGTEATSGIDFVELYYSHDGADFAAYPGGPFTASPIPFDASLVGGDGTYHFYTRAQDVAGNLEAAPSTPDAQTTIDTAAPATPVLASLPEFLTGTSATLSWSNEGAATSRAEAASDAAFSSIVQGSDWIAATEHTFTGLQDGVTYYYRVQSRDEAGNQSEYSLVTSSTQDATAPSSSVAALPAMSNAAVLALNWSAFDITSGVASVDLYYSRDGAAFAQYGDGSFTTSPIPFDPSTTGGDGSYAFFTRARDNVGNLENAPATPDAQTHIDGTAPNAPTLAGMPEFSAGSTVALSCSNESMSGALEYRVEVSTSPDFTTLAAVSNWVPVTSFVFNGLEDATTYYFRSQSRDAAHNESDYSALTQTTMDDTSPASRVDALPAVTVGTWVDVAWSASDATSGVASVDLYYALDGGAFTAYPGGPFTTSPIAFDVNQTGGEGGYSFYTRARDQVGNREAAPNAPDANTIVTTTTVGVVVLDEIPEFSAGTRMSLSWAPASGATQYLVQASEDAAFTSIFGASGWMTANTYTFNGLDDGHRYYYRVRGRNDLGVMGSFSPVRSSTQDNTPPTSQAAPLASESTHQMLDIVWSASDATSGVAGVELLVSHNGGSFSAYPGGPFNASPIAFNAAMVGGDGDYAFYTIAADQVGNHEAAPAAPDAATTIDSQAPASPAMLAEPAESRGSVNTVAWGPVADAVQYDVQCALDAMFLNVITTPGWITETSYTFTALDAGVTYYYRVRSRDHAGNMSSFSEPVWSTQDLGRILSPGWNLLAIDVAPDDPRIDRVLRPIAGSFTIVRSYEDAQFNSYLPTMPVEMNDLQQMDTRNAYWIYMTRSDTLAVKGAPVADNSPILLRAGWELVSYLPDQPQSAELALSSIRESLVLARGYDNGYASYYPSLASLSNLETLRPGYGYWLYLNQDDELIYGQFGGASAPAKSGANAPTVANAKGSVVPTVMDLWSRNVRIDGELASAGTVVEAYDADNNLLSSAKLQRDGMMLLHIPGDVSITTADEGAVTGDVITLRIQDSDSELQLDESILFEADAAIECELSFVQTVAQLPKAFSLAQNHPNPFNPSTKIAYAVPANAKGVAAHVRLQIFDIRGRVVRTLVNDAQEPGRYAVPWDGRDDQGQSVGSGVYFYRLSSTEFMQTRKMMLLK